MRSWVRILFAGVLSGAVAVVVLRRFGGAAALVAYDSLVVVVAALLAGLLVSRLGRRPAVPPASRSAHRGTEVPVLDDWEAAVAGASRSMAEAHGRLRPRLRLLAVDALARRGVDLDTEPVRARQLLGDEAWEWLRPDRPPPRDRQAAGPPVAHWSRVVDAIERAGRT